MKFKANFNIPTKDFKKYDYVELWVTTTIESNEIHNGNIEFKVKIPDFIFNELANSEPKFTTESDINKQPHTGRGSVSGCFGENEITRKFKKTQTAKTLETLQDYLYDLTNHLNDKYGIETTSSKKKIFIEFNHQQNHTTNNWCSAYQGLQISQNFKYFLGYEIMTNNGEKRYITKIEYHSKHATTSHRDTGFEEGNQSLPLLSHNDSNDHFENRFSIIDWTQEREDFCEIIQKTFINVNTELSNFLDNLDSNKMDMLMANNNLKFLGNV